MRRPYSESQESAAVRAFVGRFAGSGPASGLLTMFLVGRMAVKDVTEEIDRAHEVAKVREFGQRLSHLYFGANQSFDGESVSLWADLVRHFLREGFWCTLEFKPQHVPLIHKTGLCRKAHFIPTLSVKIPSVRSLGWNAVLKIDDAGFATSNPGVWSAPLSEFVQRTEIMTVWDDYRQDVITNPKPN